MADKHPSGNPKLVEQHKRIQRQGDHELATGNARPEKAPGKGKPDKEEGVGTVQNQKR
jgi:hypothetical protein